MALQFFDGFSSWPSILKPEWNGASRAAGVGRDGANNGAAYSGNMLLTLPAPATGLVVGLASNITDARISSGGTIPAFTVGTTRHLILGWDSTALFPQLRLASGTVLATSPTAASVGWSHYQIKVNKITAGSDGRVQVKLNDILIIDYTGPTGTATGAVTRIEFQNPAFYGTIDDLYVLDDVDASATQGRPNNDFIGDCSVVSLLPTADGASSGFAPTPAGAHWSTVDEQPVNTTDYVAASVSGTRDLYEVQDLAAAAKTVFGVRPVAYSAASDTGPVSVRTVVREPAGAVSLGPAKPLTTTWAGAYGNLLGTNPFKGGAWTVADVNALQVGVEIP